MYTFAYYNYKLQRSPSIEYYYIQRSIMRIQQACKLDHADTQPPAISLFSLRILSQ